MELTITGSSIRKALLWSKIKNTPRFRKYNRKAIHIIRNDLELTEEMDYEFNLYE